MAFGSKDACFWPVVCNPDRQSIGRHFLRYRQLRHAELGVRMNVVVVNSSLLKESFSLFR